MRVTIHGPNLRDQSSGTFRVHESSSPENAREIKLNGSTHPDENVEVSSLEEIIDRVYPASEFDREPDDLPMYVADVFVGESCNDLPLHAATTNEGEEMAEYTAEQKAEALKAYEEKASFRYVGKALSMSATTAKKVVEQAQEEAAEAARAAAATKPRKSHVRGGVTAKEDPNAMVPCRFCKDAKGNPVEHPMTTEHFYVNTSTGGLHVLGRCKVAEKLYRDERRAIKAKEAKAAAKAEKATEAAPSADGARHLSAVA